MQLKQKLLSLVRQLGSLPKKYTIPTAVLIVGGMLYVAAFIIEKPVTFSYAGQTCVNKLTLLPEMHTVVGEPGFTAQPANLVTIGDWPIAARSICVTALHAPQPGIVKVSIAPYGGYIARQTLIVTIPDAVVADVSMLDDPVPVSKPLDITLSETDTVFSYTLKVQDKRTDCQAKMAALSCDLEQLQLVQNRPYTIELIRQFKDQVIETAASRTIHTLSATTVTESSIKSGETVYAKPKEISVGFDKKVVHVDATLYYLKGKERVAVDSSVSMTDKGVSVSLAEHLKRSANYELVINEAEATDESGLVEPYMLPFKTSGGPKVTGVNVDSTGVPMGMTAIVSFDQPLSDKQDISKFVELGGGATLVGKQGNQLHIALASVPKCGDFTIKLTKDLKSRHEIAGHSAWQFTGRTVCHTVGTIGYSGQGRPIAAYYFGDGATTVLYTGAIHGNEISTKYLMDRWIQELEAKARSIPKHLSVVVVPVINPDGLAAGGRTNANNVDLNRNFATTDWQKDITTVNNQPFADGGGKAPMSESETKAIASLAQRLQPKVILSYHSIGGVVAANQAGASTTLAATYARLSGYGNVTGQSGATFEYTISGTADDWYAQKLGVASILVELGSQTYSQFERNRAAMWAMIHS